jgi:hypothetical protein
MNIRHLINNNNRGPGGSSSASPPSGSGSGSGSSTSRRPPRTDGTGNPPLAGLHIY